MTHAAASSPAPAPNLAGRERRRPFRRRDARSVYARHMGPNMTPMVDVVMVILVFFMASAAFLGPEWFLRTLVPQQAPPTPPPAPGDGSQPTKDDPLALKSLRVIITLAPGKPGPPSARGTPATTVTSTALGLESAPMAALAPALAALAKGAGPGDLEVLVQPTAGVPWADVTAASEAAVALGLRTGIDPR